MTVGAARSWDRDRLLERSPYEELIAYDEEAGPDFGQWSPGCNMHFGFYRFGMNPFRREPMLNTRWRQRLQNKMGPMTVAAMMPAASSRLISVRRRRKSTPTAATDADPASSHQYNSSAVC